MTSRRSSSRARVHIDYAKIDQDVDDDDFAGTFAPPVKKSKVSEQNQCSKDSRRKKKDSQHVSSAEGSDTKRKCPRVPLDEKLFMRDIEVALSLSKEIASEAEIKLTETISSCDGLSGKDDWVKSLEDNNVNDSDPINIDSEFAFKTLKVSSVAPRRKTGKPSEAIPARKAVARDNLSQNVAGFGTAVSPSSCLRLGLSRNVRVKPLHPSVHTTSL